MPDNAPSVKSQFQPVFLEQPLPRTLRQTWLRRFNNCPRSAFLAAKYNGLEHTAPMARGSAFHEIAARSTKLAIEMNEPMVPPDVVKAIVDEVLSEIHVPMEEHDQIREMAFRWASEETWDPGMVIACESLFELQVGDWKVRARIDFAESLENDRHETGLLIRDYKTSRAAPPFEEVARKMPDGRLVAKNFQLILYALLMHFGVPVLETECDSCHGEGAMDVVEVDGRWYPAGQMRGTVDRQERHPCIHCDATGVHELPAPFPLADKARRFDLEFVYPSIENGDGRMVRRSLTLDHLELTEYRSSLEGLVARVAKSESSGDWPAVVSDAACSECPAAAECPIPWEVRDHRGQVNSMEQAADAAMVLDRLKATTRAMQSELRNFAKVHGPVRFGGKVMELVYAESESMDWRAFLAAPPDADPQDFVSTKGRTDFRARDLKAEEVEGG